MAGQPSQRGTENGFTLVEVLAALAVFSIAAIGLVRAGSEGAKTARIIEARAMASILAENQLAERLLKPGSPEIGADSATLRFAGREWQVETRVSRTSNPAMAQLEIVAAPLNEQNGPAAAKVRMTAFRELGG